MISEPALQSDRCVQESTSTTFYPDRLSIKYTGLDGRNESKHTYVYCRGDTVRRFEAFPGKEASYPGFYVMFQQRAVYQVFSLLKGSVGFLLRRSESYQTY